MTEDTPRLNEQVVKRLKDRALQCMNSIRFRRMGRPIAPVWPKCPLCKRMCSQANDLFVMSKVGVCPKCTAEKPEPLS
jgi:hypothetical protein